MHETIDKLWEFRRGFCFCFVRYILLIKLYNCDVFNNRYNICDALYLVFVLLIAAKCCGCICCQKNFTTWPILLDWNCCRLLLLIACIWVVLRNCVPLGVGNFKLVFEGNLLLQCKYFYLLSLYVDVSDNKNNNDCQSGVLCTLNRTDVVKWIKNDATDLWHRQHHWKECIRNFIKTTQWQRI